MTKTRALKISRLSGVRFGLFIIISLLLFYSCLTTTEAVSALPPDNAGETASGAQPEAPGEKPEEAAVEAPLALTGDKAGVTADVALPAADSETQNGQETGEAEGSPGGEALQSPAPGTSGVEGFENAEAVASPEPDDLSVTPQFMPDAALPQGETADNENTQSSGDVFYTPDGEEFEKISDDIIGYFETPLQQDIPEEVSPEESNMETDSGIPGDIEEIIRGEPAGSARVTESDELPPRNTNDFPDTKDSEPPQSIGESEAPLINETDDVTGAGANEEGLFIPENRSAITPENQDISENETGFPLFPPAEEGGIFAEDGGAETATENTESEPLQPWEPLPDTENSVAQDLYGELQLPGTGTEVIPEVTTTEPYAEGESSQQEISSLFHDSQNNIDRYSLPDSLMRGDSSIPERGEAGESPEPFGNDGAAPAGGEEREPVPSRSISIARNQYLDVVYPGEGWVYLGEQNSAEDGGDFMRYFGRRIGDTDTSFSLRSRKEGETLLHFGRTDPLTGVFVEDYLAVIIEGVSQSPEHARESGYTGLPEETPQDNFSPLSTSLSNGEGLTSPPAIDNQSSVPPGEPEYYTEPESDSGIIFEDDGVIVEEEAAPMGNPDDLLNEARLMFGANNYSGALSALSAFLATSSSNLDEALFLQARIYESDGPERNIQAALDNYETIVRSYPQSSFRGAARESAIYLRQLYFDIN